MSCSSAKAAYSANGANAPAAPTDAGWAPLRRTTPTAVVAEGRVGGDDGGGPHRGEVAEPANMNMNIRQASELDTTTMHAPAPCAASRLRSPAGIAVDDVASFYRSEV
eukprot:gene24238-1850_t